jgi:hypothetical protein
LEPVLATVDLMPFDTCGIPANDPAEGLVVTLMMPSRSVGVDPRP